MITHETLRLIYRALEAADALGAMSNYLPTPTAIGHAIGSAQNALHAIRYDLKDESIKIGEKDE